MSNSSNTSTRGRGFGDFPAAVTMARAIRRHLRAYNERRARNRAVARLRSWSDSQLKDIGISRGQIEFAVKDVGDRRELRRRIS